MRLQSAQHLGSAYMRSWDNWETIASKYKASLSLSQGLSLGEWREMEEKGIEEGKRLDLSFFICAIPESCTRVFS